MNRYLQILEKTGMSLMVYKENQLLFQSNSGGIRPHLEAIEKHGTELYGTTMVDKIVGRAAALLVLYSKADQLYAGLVSGPGKQVLEEHGQRFEYAEETEHIKMKDGLIYCPFERMVQGISDPEKAYAVIVEKMNSFKNQD